MISIEKSLLLNLASGYAIGGELAGKLPSDFTPSNPPHTLILDGAHLAGLRHLAEIEESEIASTLNALHATADRLLNEGPWSVTDKDSPPEGISRNDYFSLAKYFWPNPETENGLPFVNRDGEVNPDCYSERYDLVRLERLAEALPVLALSAYLNADSAHYAHALRLLEVWFVQAETRQTPSFTHAQHIPGSERLRWVGIIEARRYIYILEAVAILSVCQAENDAVLDEVFEWFQSFEAWLVDSEVGEQAKNAKNNIAFWYDLLRIALAWHGGKDGEVRDLIVNQALPRLSDQIAPDGALPGELGRARPHDYVAFTLAALAGITAAAERVNLPLWDVLNSEGKTFAAACQWLQSLPASIQLHHSVSLKSAEDDRDLDWLTSVALALRARDFADQAREQVTAENAILKRELTVLKKHLLGPEGVTATLSSDVQQTLAEFVQREAQHKADLNQLREANATLLDTQKHLERSLRNAKRQLALQPIRSPFPLPFRRAKKRKRDKE